MLENLLKLCREKSEFGVNVGEFIKIMSRTSPNLGLMLENLLTLCREKSEFGVNVGEFIKIMSRKARIWG